MTQEELHRIHSTFPIPPTSNVGNGNACLVAGLELQPAAAHDVKADAGGLVITAAAAAVAYHRQVGFTATGLRVPLLFACLLS